MLKKKKVKRIKLGKQIYRRLMKRVLERDGWRCQRCGLLENLRVHHQIKFIVTRSTLDPTFNRAAGQCPLIILA